MSVPYKSKPARIKIALRKIWRPPGASKDGIITGTIGNQIAAKASQIGKVPYKPKPPRKGRPDGA
jgi:hypothetical protein